MARRRRILQGRAAQGICIFAAFAAISLLFGRRLAAAAAGPDVLRQREPHAGAEAGAHARARWPTAALPSGLERWYADQFRRPRSVDHRGSDVPCGGCSASGRSNGVYLGADGVSAGQRPQQEDAAQLGQTEAAICAFAAQHPDIRADGRDRAERLGRAQREAARRRAGGATRRR